MSLYWQTSGEESIILSFCLWSGSFLLLHPYWFHSLHYLRVQCDPGPSVLVFNWTWLTRVDPSHVRNPRNTPLSPPPRLQIHAQLLHQSERCYKASALFCMLWYDKTIQHYDLDSPLWSDHWKTWKDDWSETINQLIFLDGAHKNILKSFYWHQTSWFQRSKSGQTYMWSSNMLQNEHSASEISFGK